MSSSTADWELVSLRPITIALEACEHGRNTEAPHTVVGYTLIVGAFCYIPVGCWPALRPG